MIKRNVPLSDFSHFKIGGRAAYFLEFQNVKELSAGLAEWKEISRREKISFSEIFPIGGGTNLLIADEGYPGLILKNNLRLIEKTGDEVNFGAGLLFSEALDFCAENSLSGFEWAGGLPGTVGGAIRGNAGAFGGEVKDNLIEVLSFSLKILKPVLRAKNECRFSYRSSLFKLSKTKEIILSGKFKFKLGEKERIKGDILEKVNYRKEKQPLEYPNAGSIFKNIPVAAVPAAYLKSYAGTIKNDPMPVIPAARVLTEAGLKGKNIGRAMFSEKHPNFIVNVGGAKSKDVLALIELAIKEVAEKFGITLEPEIIVLK